VSEQQPGTGGPGSPGGAATEVPDVTPRQDGPDFVGLGAAIG
jgi:hypothetical protein